ncbi:Transmembrane anterior posterior transformation protein 1, partial [Fragariocoptes setiger]
MHSIGEYFYSELRRGYLLENDEQRYSERRQKFYTFLKVPIELERFMFQAFFQIVDAFLYVFTLLPIRFLLSCWFLLSRPWNHYVSRQMVGGIKIVPPNNSTSVLQPAEICDLLKGIIIISATMLISYVDTSILYHIIKSQSVIKLYIFFNMLEVADKLLSTFGCDILDALFWTATEPRDRKREHYGVVAHLIAAIFYVLLHSLLVLLQATTLNVALNSKNKALLTIMMSNNFVELKGMVFKKFEKNNLFHMSCSDVRERHHYLVLLLIVIVQTLKEYDWKEEQFWVLVPDCIMILVAEMVVDWFKHAFVTRFNEISCEVYREYTVTLAYDLASSKLKRAYADHSDLVSRRMGFIPLPLAVLVFRVFASSLTMNSWQGSLCLILAYCCMVTFKIMINIILLGKSCEIIDKNRAEAAEKAQPPPRQCTSLPSSRHGSQENLNESSLKLGLYAKSTPQSPRTILADITMQAQAMQENLEQSFIFSNSTVSLTSLKFQPPDKAGLV